MELERREAVDRREERAVGVEAVGIRRHAVPVRMRRVDLEPEDRAGRGVLLAPQSALEVPDRDRQPIDREVRRGAERDQRAAVRDEAGEILDAGFADAAAVLGPDALGVEAVDDLARRLIGKDDRVEVLPQAAAADVGVVDGRRRELVLLEHPARPPFVDVAAGPGRVQPDRAASEAGAMMRPEPPTALDGGCVAATFRPSSRASASIRSRGTPLTVTCDGRSKATRAPPFSSRLIAIAVSAPA